MQSQKPEPELLEIPGAEGLSVDYFTNLLQNYIAPTQTIPLQQIAGMTGAEQTTQDLLKKFLGTSATEGGAYKLGMGELQKTLGSEYYDPQKSDFWKGFREYSATEEEKGISDIRRRGQLGGGLFADPSMRLESEKRSELGAARSMMLGSLYEKERERKAGAVGQALGFAGLEEQGALSRLQAGSTIGALPRNIQNQQYQAAYNQALEQTQADYASSILGTTVQSGAASQLMPQWLVDQSQPADPLGGILGIVGSLVGK